MKGFNQKSAGFADSGKEWQRYKDAKEQSALVPEFLGTSNI